MGLPEISGNTRCFGLPATRLFPKLNRVGSGIKRNIGQRVGFGYPLGIDHVTQANAAQTMDLLTNDEFVGKTLHFTHKILVINIELYVMVLY